LFENVGQEGHQILAAYTGAAIGGVGAGFLWTAQGAYFGRAAEDHARLTQQALSESTASLAGIFAFLYLAEEVILRLLSTLLIQFGGFSWDVIFAVYTLVTIVSAVAMVLVDNYPADNEMSGGGGDGNANTTTTTTNTVWYKVTAAAQLLRKDPKMKYMIGLNAVFGLTGAFLNSYVNGEVVPVALKDPNSKYVGVLSSWVSGVAAVMSLLFGRVAPRTGKGPVLVLGALCFFGVVLPFIIFPDVSNAQHWGWPLLILIFTLHGTGRATFEGTLKATFADYFPYEKEGAFANIILQNGLSGAVGYVSESPNHVFFRMFSS
jgi:MFS family permease